MKLRVALSFLCREEGSRSSGLILLNCYPLKYTQIGAITQLMASVII